MSEPRLGHVEVSDPALEADGLRQVTVVSPALGGRGDVTLWIPPVAHDATDLPVVVLLHGVYGSHWAWTRKGAAHRTAGKLIARGAIGPVVLAMPSDGLLGEGSGYLSHPHADCAAWIADDVPAAVRALVPHVGDGSRFCVAGLSMGGFGALRLGALRPDRFAAAAGLSSLTHARQIAACIEDGARFASWPEPEACLFETLAAHRSSVAPFRFDCGLDDRWIDANRELHARLSDAGIDHGFEELDGGHDWTYWRKHLGRALRFFDGVLSV